MNTNGPNNPVPESILAILPEVWKAICRDFGRPALRTPKIKDDPSGTASINIMSKDITLDPAFLQQMVRKGMDPDQLLYGLLSHEVNHYRHHPYDLATLLLELHALSYLDGGKMGGPKATQIRLHFDDLIDNSNLIVKGKSDSIACVYSNMDTPAGSILSLSLAYYRAISGDDHFDSNSTSVEGFAERLSKMVNIDFTNRSNIMAKVTAYAKIVEDMLENGGNGGSGRQNGTGKDEAGSKSEGGCSDEDDTGLGICKGIDPKQFDEKDLEKAMKEVAQKVSPKEFDKIKKYAESIISHSDQNPKTASVEFYMALAERHGIKVEPTPIVSSNTTYPSGLREWEIGSGVKGLNLFKSGGRIITGLTKQWQSESMHTFGSKKGLPDSVIIIDSSGSMTDPTTSISNAVIGAFSIALAYTRNGAKADVINFSDSSSVTEYKSELDALKALVEYRGKGTNPPVAKLLGLVADTKKDITVITDGFGGAGQGSIDNFMKIINEIGKTNRVSYVYIGGDVSEIAAKYPHVQFHSVSTADDIGSIVLGDMRY